jgi:hypothetical protein
LGAAAIMLILAVGAARASTTMPQENFKDLYTRNLRGLVDGVSPMGAAANSAQHGSNSKRQAGEGRCWPGFAPEKVQHTHDHLPLHKKSISATSIPPPPPRLDVSRLRASSTEREHEYVLLVRCPDVLQVQRGRLRPARGHGANSACAPPPLFVRGVGCALGGVRQWGHERADVLLCVCVCVGRVMRVAESTGGGPQERHQRQVLRGHRRSPVPVVQP